MFRGLLFYAKGATDRSPEAELSSTIPTTSENILIVLPVMPGTHQ